MQLELVPRQLDLFRAPAKPARSPSPEARAVTAEPVPVSRAAEPRAAPLSRQEALAKARELGRRIADALGPELKVLLSVHDNRSTMVSFRRQPPLLKVRVHHMFLDAPDHVVAAIAAYAGKGAREAGQVLDDYIAARQEHIRALPRKPAALEPRGECFDLQAIFEDLNHRFFQGGIRARIGWGRQTGRRRRKTIRLGVYDHKAREIRLHPALDRPDVPRYFVEYIVFHEMLHQLFPSDRHTGRHVHHPRAFRDRERAFPRYEAALAWEKQHLHQLLRR